MPTLPPPPCFQNPSSTHVHDAPPPPPPPSPLGLGWLPPHPYVSLYLSLLHWMAPTLSSMDASHDLDHLIRVTRLSFELARSEHVTDPGSLQRILVLAMLHDVADHKYHADPTPMYQEIRKYLSQGPPSPLLFQSTDIDTLLWMIPRISFKKESTLLLLDPDEDPSQWPIELKIVQDADRLDAMGAIGLARCFVYGGAHHRPIYTDPTTFSFQRTLALNSTEVPPPSSMDHVYEKLLKIKTFMKTKTGKQLAEHRHQFLEQFVEEFWKEIQVGERDPLPVHEQKTDVDL